MQVSNGALKFVVKRSNISSLVRNNLPTRQKDRNEWKAKKEEQRGGLAEGKLQPPFLELAKYYRSHRAMF